MKENVQTIQEVDIIEEFYTKKCSEIDFYNSLNNSEKKLYLKYQNFYFNKKAIFVCTIITIIINVAGIYFSIGRNKIYKKYKSILNTNITEKKIFSQKIMI